MGAGQTYQWAVSHPEMVQRMLPFCGSSRTSQHNRVFLEGVKAALTADAAFDERLVRRAAGGGPAGGRPGLRRLGLLAGVLLGRGLGGYRDARALASLEDFLVGFWEGFFLDDRDPNNLLTMLYTWQYGDVGSTPGFAATP